MPIHDPLTTANQDAPLEPEVRTEEDTPVANTVLPEQNISGLGLKPDAANIEGKPLHEEIVVRWNSYLLNGLTKERRSELIDSYKIPENCKALIPPSLNSEVHPCLPKFAQEHDSFLLALQQQVAHGLSAAGLVLEKMLPVPDQADDLKKLADACQLFGNVHHAITTHRRYKIMPHLNQDCKKVAKTMDRDEFLFSKNFAEAVKNEQSLKKASFTFKKRTTVPLTYSAPGPSGVRSGNLNAQRQPYKERLKQKKEGRPFDRYPQQRSKKHPYRK